MTLVLGFRIWQDIFAYAEPSRVFEAVLYWGAVTSTCTRFYDYNEARRNEAFRFATSVQLALRHNFFHDSPAESPESWDPIESSSSGDPIEISSSVGEHGSSEEEHDLEAI